MFNNVFKNKKVLVTGHTGFKGSWLALWLNQLGANVYGLSLSVPTVPSHFELLGTDSHVQKSFFVDIRDYRSLFNVFQEVQPEIVFHLAAEAIVKTCLDDPRIAFDTNLGGTVNVLEAIRNTPQINTAIIVTSDKCYENVEWDYGYRENDRLGGKDPYSASKACAEIAFSAYFRSYFGKSRLKIATARAGNVIGGGDWAKDRIIPDIIRAKMANSSLEIRSPKATRPWQLVLEPLSGYLWLAAKLYRDQELNRGINGESFNFGPTSEVDVTVESILNYFEQEFHGFKWEINPNDQYAKNEAGLLKLSCDKALRRLLWKPTLKFDETLAMTSEWYKGWMQGVQVSKLSLDQISIYQERAKSRGIEWAK